MNKLLAVIIAVLLLPLFAFGQKEGFVGIFGTGVGIDFKTTPPSVFHQTPASEYEEFFCWEGTATISDKDGKLLFYTNGEKVWNRNHQLMNYGQHIISNVAWSSTQTLIIPSPGLPYLYYIFVAGQQGGPLKYALIDMRLNNGLGDVSTKNIFLFDNATEKIQAVKHATEEGIWLIAHEYGTSNFRAYLIDATGINPNYVKSAAGAIHHVNENGTNAIGYMKVSPGGKKLALTISYADVVELFDFDPATGKVSNPIDIPVAEGQLPYGLAFSPDDSKLYVAFFDGFKLVQYDLNSASAEAMINSEVLISSVVRASLQLGPDDKIYIIKQSSASHLSVINNPNAAGEACNFVEDGLFLEGGVPTLGLPEFIRYQVNIPEGILSSNNCAGKDISFNLINEENIATVRWDFGDEDSGSSNHSSELAPLHTYTTSGTFTAKAEVTLNNNQTRTYLRRITVIAPPAVSLGEDIIVCDGVAVPLNTEVSGADLTYYWMGVPGLPPQTIRESGKYWLEVRSPFCTASDTIIVTSVYTPYFTLGPEPICIGMGVDINHDSPGISYLWSDGLQQGTRTFSVPGTYKVTATNYCGSYSQEIKVLAPPTVSLGEDAYLCDNKNLIITPSVTTDENVTYRWQDGSAVPSLTAYRAGTYWVDVITSCYTVRDSIVISQEYKPSIIISQEPLCIGEVLTINLDEAETTYSWSDGVSGGQRTLTSPGRYRITGTNKCGATTQEINLSFLPKLALELPEEIVLCSGEMINMDASNPSAQFRWQDGSTNAVKQISEPGTYSVEVYNKCETLRHTIEVKQQSINDFLFYNVFTPNQDSHNQYFMVADQLLGSQLTVYNRWGKEIYFSSSYQNNWSGEGQPAGTYYVILEDKCSRQKIMRYISLIR